MLVVVVIECQGVLDRLLLDHNYSMTEFDQLK